MTSVEEAAAKVVQAWKFLWDKERLKEGSCSEWSGYMDDFDRKVNCLQAALRAKGILE